MTKLEKAKRTRKALDVSMIVFMAILGGFAFAAFILGATYLMVGAWLMGYGFIPIVIFAVALFVIFWSILDAKTEKTLTEEETNGQSQSI